MKEVIFIQNISNMFERYYSNEKNVKNEPLEEDEEREFQEISKKFKDYITKEWYKKYKHIKADVLKISSKFENAIYISRNIKGDSYEPTKILKLEIEKWDYLDFKKKYNRDIEKVEYFLPIYKLGVRYFYLDDENPFFNELEGNLIDMTSIRNNLLHKKLFDGLKKLDDLTEEQKKYDKSILNIMGIFLAIFSVIGFGISNILNIEDNHIAVCSMICGIVLITISSLFYLINFSINAFKENVLKILIPYSIGVFLMCFGAYYISKYPTKNKTTKYFETKLTILEEKNNDLEKKLDYEKRINELEKKSK